MQVASHSKSELTPIEGSLLQLTFLGLLELSDHDKAAVWSSFETLVFADLNLPEDQWKRTNEYCIYRDDSLDEILGFSIAYLRDIWPDESVFDGLIVHGLLELMNKVSGRSISFAALQTFTDNRIFHGLEFEKLHAFAISSKYITQSTMEQLYANGMSRWGDILSLSERGILRRFGFKTKAIDLIRCLYDLRDKSEGLARLKRDVARLGDSWRSFNGIMEAWTLESVKRPFAKVLLLRLGWHGGEIETLQAVGDRVGKTRERIRQMEEKGLKSLRHLASFKRLEPLWGVIEALLHSGDRVKTIGELANLLQANFEWEQPPTTDALRSLLQVFPGRFSKTHRLDDDKQLLVPKESPCLNCQEAIDHVSHLISSLHEIEASSLADDLERFCKEQCRCGHNHPGMFGESSLDYLISSNPTLRQNVRKTDTKFVHINRWNMLHGTLMPAAEAILKDAGRPMHFSQVLEEIERQQPQLKPILARNIHASLSRSTNVLLWGAGTFIHQANAQFPYDLIRRIENWVADRLKQDVPFVSVFGAFEAFKAQCLAAAIPSDYALYSCLRLSNDPLFSCPRFPSIYLRKTKRKIKYVPGPLVIEEFIRRSGGPVAASDLQTYGLHKMHLKNFQLNQFIDRAPNILRGEQKYLHVDYLRVDRSKLSRLIDSAVHLLSATGHISVAKVFLENRIDCVLMNIPDPRLLYSVFQLYASARVQANNYPQLRLTMSDRASKRGIVGEILEYLKNQERPIPYRDLERQFVEQLGYSARTLNYSLNEPEVLRYLQDCYVHTEAIEWTEQKQLDIEKIAQETYEQAGKAGNYWGDLDLILESGRLPELRMGLLMTSRLFAELLISRGKFRILGNLRRAYVPIPNKFGIASFEDLVYVILKAHHQGAESLKTLCDELEQRGIADRVTKGMLDNSEKVTIIGAEIMLTRLVNTAS